MLTTKEVRGVKVCRPNKPGKEYTKDGVPRHRRKIGKVFKTVFSPDGMRVVGFIVRRPDLLWMFKRPERFLALDAMGIQDGLIVATKGMDSWDERAIKRLEVDWDTCILWEGIEVKTEDGRELGFVDEIAFDETDGAINSLFLDDGGVARSLVGSVEIPAELMIGYRKGILIVEPEAAELLPTGGLASKAGEATARIGIEAKEGAKKTGEAVGKAVDKGTYGLGKAIGRVTHSVTDAVDEYRKESDYEERKAAKEAAKKAEAAAAKKASSSGSKTGGSSAKKSASSGSSAAKKTSSSSGSKSSSGTKKKTAGQAVGEHMKAAGSMFSDFKKEFDKAKNGD